MATNLTKITPKDFEKHALGEGVTFVAFSEPSWCGSCVAIEPFVEKAAKALKGEVKFVIVDTEGFDAFKAEQEIEGFPTLCVYEDGELIGEWDDDGLPENADEIVEFIETAIEEGGGEDDEDEDDEDDEDEDDEEEEDEA